ncbi:hypothetical protein ACFFUT_08550 [Pseudohalocynthiibacter aestuariivivens]|uniref:Antifreeze protein n=1 Tax=Pseudohalocynthiibacter aestuariivivens TaxID=1591409 RepID=A0ABV5JGB9_9RHOB|nr:hypothetical protein [Pseudohalocynthiibacter aestuariivivens]MBS9718915.1 hypothetical protein [Pseudohalocynthiibacter aestuariivivens]
MVRELDDGELKLLAQVADEYTGKEPFTLKTAFGKNRWEKVAPNPKGYGQAAREAIEQGLVPGIRVSKDMDGAAQMDKHGAKTGENVRLYRKTGK